MANPEHHDFLKEGSTFTVVRVKNKKKEVIKALLRIITGREGADDTSMGHWDHSSAAGCDSQRIVACGSRLLGSDDRGPLKQIHFKEKE